jgi:hypothetical protein
MEKKTMRPCDGPMSSGKKPAYEPPRIIDLGGTAIGEGDLGGHCGTGGSALITCGTGGADTLS